MYDILTLNPISNRIFEILDAKYSAAPDKKNPDAILVRSFEMKDFVTESKLLCVARAGAGVNNIPIPAMTEKGIAVFNTPGANANAVKELVLCAMFMSARNIVEAVGWTNTLAGNGAEVGKLVEKGKKAFVGHEIIGKTLGVIGLGAIGAKVAEAASALGMQVVGYDPYLTEAARKAINCPLTIVNSPEALYPLADYITVHVPLLDSTRGMLCEKAFALMKDGVTIINCARGELAVNADVKAALASGKLFRYVTDFPTEEDLNFKGIIAIPHLGASTEEAEDNCAVMAAEEIKGYLEQGNIVNSVNFPALSVPLKKGYARTAVIYRADGGALCELRDILSETDCDFYSAEKKGIGYALIDTLNPLAPAIIERIGKTEQVIKIRQI